MKPQAETSRAPRGRAGGAQAPYWIAAVLALVLAVGAIVGVNRASDTLSHDRRADAAAGDLLSLVTTTRTAAAATTGPTPGSELDAAAKLAQLEPAIVTFEQVADGAAAPVRAAFDTLTSNLAAAERQILTGQAEPAAVDQSIAASNQGLIDAVTAVKSSLHTAATDGRSRFIVIIAGAFAIAGLIAAGLFVLLARIRRATARMLREQEARFRAIMQFSGDVIAVLNRDGEVQEQSASMLRLLGRSDQSLTGRPFAEIVQEGDRVALAQMILFAATHSGEPARARLQLAHVDGTWRAFDAIAAPMIADPSDSRIMLTCRPAGATAQSVAAPQPTAPAVQHPISGMLSETILRDRLQHALTRAMRTADPVSFLLIDFEPDQRISELSDDARAAVYRTLSGRLVRAVRGGDSVGHLGDFELGVILEEADRSVALTIARRMNDALRQPVAHMNGQITLTPRMGIATKQDPRDTVDTLMLDARTSLARGLALAESLADASAGDANRPTVAGAPAEASGDPVEALHISNGSDPEAAMPAAATEAHAAPSPEPPAAAPAAAQAVAPAPRAGFDSSSVDVLYLPALALETGEIVEMETIVRWRHPQRGWIPLAASGMSAEVLPWLLAHTCSVAGTLPPTRNGRRVRLSVNLTPETPIDDALVDLVATTLLTTGAEPSNLQLDVPARMVDHTAEGYTETIESLRQLRELGVRLTLDGAGAEPDRLPDFGLLPVHGVKIDRSVVALLDRTAERRSLVRALVDRAKPYDVRVCGTGVDSLEQAERLWDLGVDEGQGPLFFRPVNAGQLRNLFNTDASQAAD